MKLKLAIFSVLAATKVYAETSYQMTCSFKDKFGDVTEVISCPNSKSEICPSGLMGIREVKKTFDDDSKIYVGFYPPTADEAGSYFQMELNEKEKVVPNLITHDSSKDPLTLKADGVVFSCVYNKK